MSIGQQASIPMGWDEAFRAAEGMPRAVINHMAVTAWREANAVRRYRRSLADLELRIHVIGGACAWAEILYQLDGQDGNVFRAAACQSAKRTRSRAREAIALIASVPEWCRMVFGTKPFTFYRPWSR